ncbi:MAG TPA: phosphotransferase family protein [Myxococcota bacterium]|nr:phosphotransferase family protein [Myxococcota bacterium]
MDLPELEQRLVPFARAKYADPAAEVFAVHKMPGHAGFSYGWSVRSRGVTESWFLRLPPPNVQWKGTADVLRQAAALRALDGGPVPHCSVKWAGEELEFFGSPYFVVPKLEGDVLLMGPGEWAENIPAARRREMARAAMTALAQIHRVDWRAKLSYLGAPIPFEDDVVRWDRFVERAAEPESMKLVPEVRAKLLARIPHDAHVGLFHGDYNWRNTFWDTRDGRLLAVIDWELCGIGATLNDIGWVATFADPEAWAKDGVVTPIFVPADELVELYQRAWGESLADVNWFRALAAYKFSIITGLNLGLHRRGKRHDPLWEVTGRSIVPLLERARALLG